MTVSREIRWVVSIFLALAVASALFFVENPRQVHASLGSDIVCFVFNELKGVGTPIPVLDAEGCQNPPDVPAQCTDTIDNDGDGLIDYPADPGCASASDNNESNPPPPPPSSPIPQCSDGIDNDQDGKIDWNALPNEGDQGCATPLDDNESDEPPPPPPPPPPAPACSNGSDDDGDELIDSADPGCANAEDTDETNVPAPPPTGGGGDPPTTPTGGGNGPTPTTGGGNGGGGVISGPLAIGFGGDGLVLGTTTEACDQYLTAFIRFGRQNDESQVRRLQMVLRDFESATLEVNGVYDTATLAAVNALQAKYASEILTPWSIAKPTGFVYLTTRKKINEIYCRGTNQFPLTPSETQTMQQVIQQESGVVSPALKVPATPASLVAPSTPQEGEVDASQQTVQEETSLNRGLWDTVKDFFSRVFRSR
ncbi:MAG: Uncharacterized protein G01um101456_518 [Parcubacteria group bacterium Gr01-1014_56]|nr:MAG: Uncharacterized protein G01um101456_518 [Parcubacteria group bacterium Gr01-1014_56]